MANTIAISVVADVAAMRRGIDSANGSLKSLDDRSRKTSKSVGLLVKGMAALGAAKVVIGFLGDAVDKASDLNETVSKSNTIFGKNAREIRTWAKSAATDLGMTSQEAIAGASTFGNFFDQIGIGSGLATKMSKRWVRMATDLGSFHNAAPVDVMNDLASATRGEYDALQKYIPTINAAAVEQKALAMTGKDNAKELTAQEKALAVYQLTLKGQGKAAGDFQRTQDSQANQQKILNAQWEEAVTLLGKELLPVVNDVTRYLVDNMEPGIEKVKDGFEDIKPVLETVFDTLKLGVGIVSSMSGPTKTLALQVGLAYLAFGKLRGVTTGMGSAFSGYIANVKNAETRTARLRGAVGGLAGVGGLLAITKSAGSSNEALGILGSTAGGALLGFGAAGPWGAAVGAGAGLIYGLHSATKDTTKALEDIKPPTDAYTDTLDEMSGALTRATREMILHRLEKQGAIEDAAKFDIKARDLIGAVLGEEDALKRVNKRLSEHDGLKDLAARSDLRRILEAENEGLRNNQKELRDTNLELKTWKQALKGVPKQVVTRLRQLDFDPSFKQIKRLQEQYDLTPKQLKVIMKSVGFEPSRRQAKDLDTSLRELNKVRPDLGPFKGAFKRQLIDVDNEGKRKIGEIVSDMHRGTSKASPNLTPFSNEFNNKLNALKSQASSGGSSIGSNLGAGVTSGIGGYVGSAISAAQNLVRSAISAARAEAQIKSPSRKTRKIGRQMGEGLEKGLTDRQKKVKKATQALVKDIANTLAKRKEYAAAIRSSMIDMGNITTLPSAFTGAAIAQAMKAQLAKALEFQTTIKSLIKKGLNKTAIDQLLQAGAESGLASAQALLTDPAAIKDINKTQRELAAAAKALGDAGARYRFDMPDSARIPGTKVTIQVNVSPTADQAAIGRQIAKALDAFYSQGGRRRS